MHVHMISVDDSCMVRPIGDVFACDLDFSPSGVKMVEVLSLDRERLSLYRVVVFALLVGRTAGLHGCLSI